MHIVACINCSYFVLMSSSILCGIAQFFIHLPDDEYLSCLEFGVTTKKKAAVNICVYIFVWTYIFILSF